MASVIAVVKPNTKQINKTFIRDDGVEMLIIENCWYRWCFARGKFSFSFSHEWKSWKLEETFLTNYPGTRTQSKTKCSERGDSSNVWPFGKFSCINSAVTHRSRWFSYNNSNERKNFLSHFLTSPSFKSPSVLHTQFSLQFLTRRSRETNETQEKSRNSSEILLLRNSFSNLNLLS
jgi:hypothetical protein